MHVARFMARPPMVATTHAWEDAVSLSSCKTSAAIGWKRCCTISAAPLKSIRAICCREPTAPFTEPPGAPASVVMAMDAGRYLNCSRDDLRASAQDCAPLAAGSFFYNSLTMNFAHFCALANLTLKMTTWQGRCDGALSVEIPVPAYICR